ncbi:helix-turn-helix transcriptional regulator [Microbacterium panaciterrae]|uniref:HTH cro/C1-type domain-containing protein n=1 Tax=Microbacterium panaciterrae TaxID=985759 RepID=A0ABP8PHQ7_9MICO
MPRVASPAAAHIGARIKGARESSTMTQDQLAVGSEIDSSNIRAYEAGRALPNLQSLVRIAEALKTPAGYFLEGLTFDMFPVTHADRRRRKS